MQTALQDGLDLVSRVATEYDKYKPIWDKYFPEADHPKVQAVWNQIMSDPNNPGTGEDRPQYCIIIGQDISHDNAEGDPCADGAAAYTVNVPSGLLPPGGPLTTTVSYYCPPSFQVPAKYDTINCNDIGDTVSEAMDFLGATIVHEWTHNDAIGMAATGTHITDVNGLDGYGPTAVRNLLIHTPEQCINNADSYTWLALEVFWTKLCLKDPIPFYRDPPGVDNPTTTPSAPPPPPPAPTVAPADPPAAASCVPTPTDDVKDSHEDDLQTAARFFCSKYASGTVTDPSVNVAQTVISNTVSFTRGPPLSVARLYTGSKNEDDVYDISVKSVDGCTPNAGYNLETPVANNQCPDILHSAWSQCISSLSHSLLLLDYSFLTSLILPFPC